MDNNNRFFHGKVNRENATKSLLSAQVKPRDGHFLVRESLRSPGYVLSLVCGGQVFHYQISSREDGCLRIDDGPLFRNLELVVQHYRIQPDGLPCKLTSPAPGGGPPPAYEPPRQSFDFGGPSLHQASAEGNMPALLRHLAERPQDVNCRDMHGSTPLLESIRNGQETAVKVLLSHRADPSIRDTNGNTALKLATTCGHTNIIRMLLEEGGCDVQDRAPKSGWVPLHESALYGYTDVCRLLLNMGAPLQPRTPENETPHDVAIRCGQNHIVELLEMYSANMPPPKSSRRDWLHRSLNRQGAILLLQKSGMRDGSFMVRPSSRTVGFYALSLCYMGECFHYEICSISDYQFFIDDGPYFDGLEYLIDYYKVRSDGLRTTLQEPVRPDRAGTAAGSPMLFDDQITRRPSQMAPNFSQPTPMPPARGVSTAGGKRVPGAHSMPSPSPVHSSHFGSMPGDAEPPPPPPSTARRGSLSKTLNREDVTLGRLLGEGEFGAVLKGTYRQRDGRIIDVAVKTLRGDDVPSGQREFMREARVMMSLNNPCVVKLIGVVQSKPMMLVQELVALGSLLNYLLDHVDNIDVSTMELWASQIANGMVYLETKKFVHRDLAARNILLSSLTQAKISDFGLSRAFGADSDYYRATEGGRWPVKWYAPESINYGTFSSASDVWSYGVTLWEMYSFGAQPYSDMRGVEVLEMLEIRGERLARPNYCPEHTYRLMLKCWSLEERERPTFSQLYQFFLNDPGFAAIRSHSEFYQDPRTLI